MERIKSFFASALIALILFAGFGFGIIAIGFAIVLGGAFMLALRLAMPGLAAAARRHATAERVNRPETEQAPA